MRRGATPADLMLDCVRWWGEVAGADAPRWSSPHEIVFEAPVARLRDFSTAGPRSKVVPTLVLPPQAGHDSCIVDYSAQQSQMRTILNAGLTRAFTLDWIGATAGDQGRHHRRLPRRHRPRRSTTSAAAPT